MKPKQKSSLTAIITDERITGKIYYIRGKKVMFDRDLAELYDVETKVLNQAVKRNIRRFPDDFMFKLSPEEMLNWKSQIVTSNGGSSSRSQIVTLKRGQNIKYFSYVFTEQGVAMLSSVLKSDRAIDVNIQIMRTFTKLREMLLTHKELRDKIEKMELKYDSNFKTIFKIITKLMATDTKDNSKELKIVGFEGK